MEFIKYFLFFTIIFTIILNSCSPQPVSYLYANINSDRPIYGGPDVRVGEIGQISTTRTIKLIGKKGDTWVAFNFNGSKGWIQEYFLEIDGNHLRLPEISYSLATVIPTPYEKTYGENLVASDCICTHNAYDCKDFQSQILAQFCFYHCMKLVGQDIHWLDDDNDGKACELNP